MSHDEATPIVIELAKGFISLVRQMQPDWQKAYLRFSNWDSVSEIKGSYLHPDGVRIIPVTEHKDFFHPAARKGKDLLVALGKGEGVFLLLVDSNFDYEFKFDHQTRDKWKISKLDGGTGIPEGLE